MKKNMSQLPKQLKSLVRDFTTLLGEVVLEEAGAKSFNLVENIRLDMVTYRKASKEKQREILSKLYAQLEIKDSKRRNEVAHAFTLMLEIINSCEIAYRTYRLKETNTGIKFKKQSNSLVYVLTAHPTEARTPQNIDLFHRIQNIAVRLLDNRAEKDYLLSIVKHNLKLAWLMPITRHTKPQVIDEANHLYSIIFRPDIFDTILRSNRDLGNVRVRTWVGGDKDGHPGVDEKVMVRCLQASRDQFQKIILGFFNLLEKDLSYLSFDELNGQVKDVKNLLKNFKQIKKGDALMIREFRKSLEKLYQLYKKSVGAANPRIRKIFSVMEMFPGLVIPLELREDSEIISQALNATKPLAISRMIRTLDHITQGGELCNYAQGMIISMCESFPDISNTIKLMKANLTHGKKLTIPIVPLFETSSALEASTNIVQQAINDKEFSSYLTKNWNNNFEIMLGYSDSSKGMGVLASRLGIAKTMRSLDLILREKEINPIFFHGSGGSIDRGGGSLQEQTAWWPRSALDFYKATIQGEMVERQFSSPEVLLSGVHKILSSLDTAKPKEGEVKVRKIVNQFAESVSLYYQQMITDPDFFNMVEQSTPYSYLKVLKLGSRPSKRAKAASLDFSSIRAIPWVLCWTQTRTLFPTWWGVGSTWREFKKSDLNIKQLKEAYKNSSIFASFIRILGFTLSKVDLEVFHLYLEKSSLTKEQKESAYKSFKTEFQNACHFTQSITGEKNILWFRPWLHESIQLRSPMIHPLNVLQILGHNSQDVNLVRKATAGISSGMLTTG
jgi:phosphoenolpyruvate carboxylase